MHSTKDTHVGPAGGAVEEAEAMLARNAVFQRELAEADGNVRAKRAAKARQVREYS